MVLQRAGMVLASHSTLTTGLFRPSRNCRPHPSPLPSLQPVSLRSPPALYLNRLVPPFLNPFSLPRSPWAYVWRAPGWGKAAVCVAAFKVHWSDWPFDVTGPLNCTPIPSTSPCEGSRTTLCQAACDIGREREANLLLARAGDSRVFVSLNPCRARTWVLLLLTSKA